MKKGITLIGMPFSGKSTVGKIMAQNASFNFVDLDELIKEKEDRSHVLIMEKEGELELMRLEELYTLSLDLNRVIFSPGGSIIYSKKALNKIKEESMVFFLNVPFCKLEKRSSDCTIESRGIVDLKKKGFKNLFNSRVPIYIRNADYIIDCLEKNADELAEEILLLYSKTRV